MIKSKNPFTLILDAIAINWSTHIHCLWKEEIIVRFNVIWFRRNQCLHAYFMLPFAHVFSFISQSIFQTNDFHLVTMPIILF